MDTLRESLDNILFNNEKALEIIRMMRGAMPDHAEADLGYNIYTILGVVQETLEKNEEELGKCDLAMISLENEETE